MRLTAERLAERDALLGVDTSSDHTSLEGLTVETLEALIERGLCDPRQTQNDSPSVEEFLDFMRANPEATAHGYAIGSDRSDARVSLEGLHVEAAKVRPSLIVAFVNAFRHADEFDIDGDLRCWWD